MNELSHGQLVKHRAVIECAPDHCQHRSMTGLGQDNDDLETVPVDTGLILVPLVGTGPFDVELAVIHRTWPCHPIVTSMFHVVFGSGTFWNVHANAMGDGFTAAGWIVAAETLMVALPITSNHQHCRCWKKTYCGGRRTSDVKKAVRPEGIDLDDVNNA